MGTFNGGEGNDTIKGTNNNDVINGRAGNDSLLGLNGADLIITGSGNDTVNAGDGDDLVVCGTLTSGNSGGLNYAVPKEILKVNLGAGDDFIALHSTLLDGSYIFGGLGIDTINLAESSGIRTEQEIKQITGFENWILTGNIGVQIGAKSLLQKNIYSGIYTDLVIEPNSIKIYNENVDGLSQKLTVFYEAVNGNVFDASAVDYAGIQILVTTSSGTTSKIIGSQRADDVLGSGSSDEIKGEGGDDIINAGDGVDTAIFSGNHADYTISEITYNTFSVKDNVGTDGTDTIIDVNKLQFADQTVDVEIKGMEIIGDDSAEEISGGDESDRIDGAGGNDLLDGGLGNDLVEGGTGNDELNGGQGNDFLNGGTGVDELFGGVGNDELDGGADDDLANYSSVDSNLTINLATGVATGEGTDTLISIEDVIGGSNNDTITGSDASNEITSGSGDDVVNAGGGDDLIVGGDGAGNDTYNGGTGIDTIKYTSAKSGITINLSATSNQAKSTLAGDKAGIGIDQLSGIENIIAGNYDDLIIGNSSVNHIEAGSGNDTIDGGSGTDILIGGTGNDTYIIDLYKETTTLALQDTITEKAGSVNGTDTLKLRLTNDQGLAIQTFALIGSLANLESIDASNTSTNKINLGGNALANTLTGNSASNTLDGGSGTDKLIGGDGNDIYVVDNSGDVVTESNASLTQIDEVRSLVTWTLGANLENLALTGTAAINGNGNALANTITGNSAVNILTGGAGNDTLDGGIGVDVMWGGAGNDIYYVDNASDQTNESISANNTADATGTDLVYSSVTRSLGNYLENLTLTGTTAINGTGNVLANTLTGNTAANTLKGEAGSDTLCGGLGSDSLYGGAGDKVKDVFDFNTIYESKTGATRDKVYDFVTKIDKLDLSGIDANTATAKAGDQAFLFNSTTAKANSVWYQSKDVDGSSKTSDIIVYGDVNGDAKADFEIGLVGVTSIAATDFVL